MLEHDINGDFEPVRTLEVPGLPGTSIRSLLGTSVEASAGIVVQLLLIFF